MSACVCFAVPSKLPRLLLGLSFPLSCDTVVSLPPHSVLWSSLLFYEPLDLGAQRLQILLLERAKSFRLRYNMKAAIINGRNARLPITVNVWLCPRVLFYCQFFMLMLNVFF